MSIQLETKTTTAAATSTNSYEYVVDEVLSQPGEVEQRNTLLYRGLILGKAYKKQVLLTFKTNSGSKEVQDLITRITNNNVLLSSGVVIPRNCIEDVRFL